jgi:hypothetical protein
VDPQARHVPKSVHARQDGYKAHVAVEPETGLFTAGEVTEACGADNHEAVVGLPLDDDPCPPDGATADGSADEPTPASTGFEVFADSAYGTGQARAALAAAGHIAVIKPAPLRPAVDGGLTIDDFLVDEFAGTLTCPGRVTRRLTRARHAVFGAACRTCPLPARCTTDKDGRTLRLHPHDALLRQARRDWADRDDLRRAYRRHRPMVERSIAWLIGPDGRCRRLRYRGAAANHWWLHTRMAALNLHRLINLGLARRAGCWAVV